MAINGTNTFRAFRSRNYALYFAGQSVSQIGTWMQRTAISWVIYSMTHSAVMLGLTIFAGQFPSFLLSLVGGIVSDRYNRYKLLLITQTASMLQAILLTVLTLTHHHEVWQILTLSVILGVINAFDVPARQPLVHEMVKEKADLPNALAFNSSMVNLARLLGPALSGLVLVKFGAGICFLVNALSFVAVLISLLLMKLPPYVAVKKKRAAFAELADGFRYIRTTPTIGLPLLMLALMSLLVLPYNTLLPVFAKIVFKGDAATFGYINSFIGLGALAGALFLASLKPGANLRKILLINTVIFGVCLISFSRIGNFPVAMVFATIGGFGMMSQTTICNMIIQVQAEPAMRGRVISYFAMSVFGMLPLGSLITGAVSHRISSQATMCWQGVIALVIATIFFTTLRKDRLNKKEIEAEPEVENIVVHEV